MKNFWKWILGIIVVLVVLFGLGIGARLLMANFYPAYSGGYYGYNHPMMGGGGFSPFGGMMSFGGGFMMLGWLVPLILIGLVVYGVYSLGKRTPPAAPPPAPFATCPKCGQPVQAGWNHCASCGKKL
ncbi:MAG: zinc ribbon domain-containing protein [Chloroflexota bacterium]